MNQWSRRGVLTGLVGVGMRGQEKKSELFGDAEAYERFMGRWSRKLAPLLVEFANPAEDGQVLDIGSGTGSLAFSIATARPRCQVVGIDPSKEYTAFAMSRNRFGQRVSFQVGDAQQLPFANTTFQACLSLLVFNFIPHPRKALRELVRVTRPGGSISAAVWDYGAGMQMLRLFWDAVQAVDPTGGSVDEAQMPLSHKGELGHLWNEVGLKSVEERPLEIEQRFQSFSDYWDPFLNGQGPAGAYLRKLDEGNRRRLGAELKRRLALSSETVPFTLRARAWAVRGTAPLQNG